LKYLYSITSEELNQKAYGILNSVAIVEPNKFYVTRFMDEPAAPWGNPGDVLVSMIKALVTKPTAVYFCEYDEKTKILKIKQVA